MKKERRELMLSVINDYPPCIPIMHQLSHYVHCDKFLRFLLLNKITGRDLFDWVKIEFNNSIMAMVQFIVKYCNKNKETKPIYLNKDWIK